MACQRMSFSVPKDLWERAERITGETSPSKIIQRALIAMVGDQDEELAEIWEDHPFLVLADDTYP